MRIFLTGDIHGNPNRLSKKNWTVSRELNKEDLVLILGDFGILWSNNPDRSERYWLDWLDNECNFTTCFIDGNHDNHNRLKALPKEVWNNGIIGRVSDSVIHLKRGEIYVINGKKFLTIGGAASTDKAHRTIDVSWWADELLSKEEEDYAIENLEVNNWKVDYILTHTAPLEIVRYMYRLGGVIHPDPVSNFLDHVKSNTSFKKWYFGHLHKDMDFLNYHSLYNRVLEIKCAEK